MLRSKKRRFKRRLIRHKYRNKNNGTSMEEYTERNEILLQLGFKDYKAYCRSDLWKSIRARKLAIDPNCYVCEKGPEKCQIQVHHSKYLMSNLSGKSLDNLFTLCALHHKWCEISHGGYKRNPTDATKEMFRIRKLFLNLQEIQ